MSDEPLDPTAVPDHNNAGNAGPQRSVTDQAPPNSLSRENLDRLFRDLTGLREATTYTWDILAVDLLLSSLEYFRSFLDRGGADVVTSELLREVHEREAEQDG